MSSATNRQDRVRAGYRLAMAAWLLAVAGCRTSGEYRQEADDVAYKVIERKQREALGRNEPFTIERPADTLRRRLLLDQKLPTSGGASLSARDIEPIEQWPEDDYLTAPPTNDSWLIVQIEPDKPMVLTLSEGLQIAARDSREYQTQKESVFRAALDLDLEEDNFRKTWSGMLDGLFSADTDEKTTVAGIENSNDFGLSRTFKNGMTLTAAIALDLVQLFTQDHANTSGLTGDASLSIPLLRGSGKFVVTEPLTQAERDTVYAIYAFERFKRTFAVRIASDYLDVLRQLDQVQNTVANYRGLIAASRRARRLADAGNFSEIQVDQAKQNELRARNRWISAKQAYGRRLDAFKTQLGLPADAKVELDPRGLEQLADTIRQRLKAPKTPPVPPPTLAADAPIVLEESDPAHGGPYEMDWESAVLLALKHRLDLRTQLGRVFDAQRDLAVSADHLRADLTLLGSHSAGESRSLSTAESDRGRYRSNQGSYSVLIGLDLPLERTAERNAYRGRLIDLEIAVRDVQQLEDRIKLDVRNGLRDLLEARETLRIQSEAVRVAERRVRSTKLYLDRGRAQIRDLLDANEDLLDAQNTLTGALVDYRVAELGLQRDVGLLQVNEQGLWQEYDSDAPGAPLENDDELEK